MPGVSSGTVSTSTTPQEHDGVNKLYITAEETVKPEEAKIEGKLPAYVTGGKYLRVGPSKFDFPEFTVNHWLDGYAILSKFEIKDDAVVFEKKYVQSDAYKKAMELQKPAINEFATRAQADSKKGFFARVISTLLPEFTDNSYSTLFQLGHDVFATCDTQFFHQINPSKIEVDRKCDASKLFGVNGHCAHPLRDVNGDVYNMGFTIGATGIKYHVFKIPYAKTSDEMMKNAKILASVSPRWTGQMGTTHSFGMSENYLLFVEQPYIVSTKRIAASFVKGDTLKDWLEWRPDEKNRFYIVEKKTGKVFKTEFLSATAFYFMHFVNCYEESNQVILDIITYDSPKVIEALSLSNLRTGNQTTIDLPCIQRFILPIVPDLKVANVREDLNLVTLPNTNCSAVRNGNKIIITGEKLSGYGLDMPMSNKQFFGRKTRYIYTSCTDHTHEFSNSVCKMDLETRKVLKWKLNDFNYPGEPYFVANPKGTEEDDGVVIVALTDRRTKQNDHLVFLDAKDMKEIARADFQNHIPTSLHGIFIPN